MPKERVIGYDVARALAILGMILVHFCVVMSGQHLKTGWVQVLTETLDGRAAALFVVLAGVGVSLRGRKKLDDGGTGRAAVDRTLRRRGLFLFVVGFLNLIIWPGDILRVYGVVMFFSPILLGMSDRRLLCTGLGFVAGFIALLMMFDYSKHWDWETMEYQGLWTPSGAVRNLFYDGFRSVFPWAGLFCFGMWFGRLDLANGAVRKRVGVICAALLVGAVILSRVLIHFATNSRQMKAEDAEFLFGTISMPPLPIFLLTTAGSAGLTITICLSLAERLPNNLLVRALTATGRMAFTWYIAHIVLGLGGVVVLGLYPAQPPARAVATACGFFIAAMLISTLWMKRFKHGPLEALLRRIAG